MDRPIVDDRPDGLISETSLWTQREAAAYLGVSGRYLRDSTCPCVRLPGGGGRRRRVVRYFPGAVRAWAAQWGTGSEAPGGE